MQPSGIHTHLVIALLVATGLVGAAATAGADLLKKPSELRRLTAGVISPNNTEDMLHIGPAGLPLGTYRVPEKNVLIITTVTIRPISPGAGYVQPQLLRGVSGNSGADLWNVPMDRPTQFCSSRRAC